eukprot:137722-Rhodomonas_salina.1
MAAGVLFPTRLTQRISAAVLPWPSLGSLTPGVAHCQHAYDGRQAARRLAAAAAHTVISLPLCFGTDLSCFVLCYDSRFLCALRRHARR